MNCLAVNRTLVNNLTVFVRRFRYSVKAFSDFQKERSFSYVVASATPKRQWPNLALGPIDSVHPSYPLPGGVGLITEKVEESRSRLNVAPATHSLPSSREEHYTNILVETYNATELDATHNTLIPPKSETLECSIYACPTLIKNDLASIFASKKFESTPLTAIVLSHKTSESLYQWSEMAASERETIAENFTQSAIDICASLKELGYWADFINPFTGTPYLGKHGESSLMETDERMKHFGFELDETFCCKILRHPRWKHNVFAGLIFTDAPKSHPVLAHF